MMKWAKNLRAPMLPRLGGRGERRIWSTVDDIARFRNREDDTPDYSAALSEADTSSAIMGCVEWIAAMLPRCPWVLERKTEEGLGVHRSPSDP